uniref:Reverse transcriptase domain-containing protein n=1 Tax=Chromera velia CCMP2878 TaxID=1169474 RepID=A0A0G4H8A0_9ALVE|eukprot:Cvel_25099.t1-p1 / transcript=Cvel_25099.t1 / gene=Cvel_25099 / organism=Chromera_velia_CCMP2878 / gene_product=hypothetical protein / transcript_product=hypothetical protein / location=Cvel_scaffold2799:3286-18019(+) / protein_length=571 / sequence_SO=supercontig / SO=protein_coding / is_pseudo=false
MDERLREQTSLDNCQLGFRKGVGTRKAIAALAGLIASSKALKLPLLAAFVDFSKAFDKVPRGLLLRRLREEGVSECDVLMVHAMYFDVWARVDGADREIQEGAGVKQPEGDPLSPLLFFLFINNLHRHIRLSAHREDEVGGEELEKDGTVSDERSIESRTCDYPWAGRLRGVGIGKRNKKTEVAVKRKRGKVRKRKDFTEADRMAEGRNLRSLLHQHLDSSNIHTTPKRRETRFELNERDDDTVFQPRHIGTLQTLNTANLSQYLRNISRGGLSRAATHEEKSQRSGRSSRQELDREPLTESELFLQNFLNEVAQRPRVTEKFADEIPEPVLTVPDSFDVNKPSVSLDGVAQLRSRAEEAGVPFIDVLVGDVQVLVDGVVMLAMGRLDVLYQRLQGYLEVNLSDEKVVANMPQGVRMVSDVTYAYGCAGYHLGSLLIKVNPEEQTPSKQLHHYLNYVGALLIELCNTLPEKLNFQKASTAALTAVRWKRKALGSTLASKKQPTVGGSSGDRHDMTIGGIGELFPSPRAENAEHAAILAELRRGSAASAVGDERSMAEATAAVSSHFSHLRI